jgi:hypothetical protein
MALCISLKCRLFCRKFEKYNSKLHNVDFVLIVHCTLQFPVIPFDSFSSVNLVTVTVTLLTCQWHNHNSCVLYWRVEIKLNIEKVKHELICLHVFFAYECFFCYFRDVLLLKILLCIWFGINHGHLFLVQKTCKRTSRWAGTSNLYNLVRYGRHCNQLLRFLGCFRVDLVPHRDKELPWTYELYPKEIILAEACFMGMPLLQNWFLSSVPFDNFTSRFLIVFTLSFKPAPGTNCPIRWTNCPSRLGQGSIEREVFPF